MNQTETAPSVCNLFFTLIEGQEARIMLMLYLFLAMVLCVQKHEQNCQVSKTKRFKCPKFMRF